MNAQIRGGASVGSRSAFLSPSFLKNLLLIHECVADCSVGSPGETPEPRYNTEVCVCVCVSVDAVLWSYFGYWFSFVFILLLNRSLSGYSAIAAADLLLSAALTRIMNVGGSEQPGINPFLMRV